MGIVALTFLNIGTRDICHNNTSFGQSDPAVDGGQMRRRGRREQRQFCQRREPPARHRKSIGWRRPFHKWRPKWKNNALVYCSLR